MDMQTWNYFAHIQTEGAAWKVEYAAPSVGGWTDIIRQAWRKEDSCKNKFYISKFASRPYRPYIVEAWAKPCHLATAETEVVTVQKFSLTWSEMTS